MRYPDELKAEIERLVVSEGKDFSAISRLFDGRPSKQTIANWANAPDEQGRTWITKRRERATALISMASPDSLVMKLTQRINALLERGGDPVKEADAIRKHAVSIRELVDPVYQASMTLQVLQRFLTFVREHHTDLVTPELADASQDFKESELRRLGV